jgi:hypothetical protein
MAAAAAHEDEEEFDVVMEFPEFEDTNLITTAKQYSLIVSLRLPCFFADDHRVSTPLTPYSSLTIYYFKERGRKALALCYYFKRSTMRRVKLMQDISMHQKLRKNFAL